MKLLAEDSIINDELIKIIENYGADNVDAVINHDRDFQFDYFAWRSLHEMYLTKTSQGKQVERPQHMWMRVAIGIHGNDIKDVLQTYDLLSKKYFTHATPTLFNSGTRRPQLSSCFLLNTNDCIEGITTTWDRVARISKWAGGIGLSIHDIRARGSKINGTNGDSTGIVPMLKVYNDTAKYVNQGGKRNGSFAIYLEPWHADIEDFLKLRLNQGAEEDRARDLFYALWIPDLFMKRVEDDGNWTLMCPSECPALANVYGQEFEDLYSKYECEGKGRKTLKAKDIWKLIMDAQIQTGTPYLCYKDSVNEKSNQKHLGTIRSSNLCVAPETLILTDKGHFPIKDLEDKEVNVWNGDRWSKTTIRKTGSNQKLIDVYFSNGAMLTCTPYHKFLIQEDYSDHSGFKDCERIEAQNLEEGMKLKKFNPPVCTYDNEDFPFPYTH